MSAQAEAGPAPIRSMTGFAQVRKQTDSGELTVSLRTVNHRGLDLHFYQSSEFAAFENEMRARLKQHIRRGHVEVRISVSHSEEDGTPSYNRASLARYVAAYRQAAEEFDLESRPDLNTLLSLPGVLKPPSEPSIAAGQLGSELLDALSACIAELNVHREREGDALRSELSSQIEGIGDAARQIQSIRSKVLPLFRARLHEKLTELLGSSSLTESRLVEEAALLADRSDIAEELTRLSVHTVELRQIFSQGGEVGKRLDFLLQEMNRETNTILSKSSGIGDAGLRITGLALEVKVNIERIREQALNLE
ncbi:MAG: YicC family protein [Acidobacteriaceae bacterium]|nr:YicC family protein [Acidobacteriaceae bacterium]MBV9501193.1 YicC family protein [Acidobacteriaceae bacterium]